MLTHRALNVFFYPCFQFHIVLLLPSPTMREIKFLIYYAINRKVFGRQTLDGWKTKETNRKHNNSGTDVFISVHCSIQLKSYGSTSKQKSYGPLFFENVISFRFKECIVQDNILPFIDSLVYRARNSGFPLLSSVAFVFIRNIVSIA